MRSIKQRRTKPRTDSNGNIKRSTFNGTSKTKQYVNKNTYLDIVHAPPVKIYSDIFLLPVESSSTGHSMLYSYDGINWEGLGIIFDTQDEKLNAVKWNGEIWVAVGQNNTTAIIGYSMDGLNWTQVAGNPFGNNMPALDLEWNGEKWLAITNLTGGQLIESYDGKNWTNLVPNGIDEGFLSNGIAYGDNKWILFGQTSPYSTDNIYYSANNGINWTLATSSIDSVVSEGYYNGKIWVAVGVGSSNNIASSNNGIDWSGISSNIGYGADILYGNNIWVAVGTGGGAYSTDGISWNSISDILGACEGVTWNKNLNLWVASNAETSSINDFYYSNNGIDWTGIPTNTSLLPTGYGAWLSTGLSYVYKCKIVGCNCSEGRNTSMCKGTPYRNPILGYRKQLVETCKDASGDIYIDNYAKSCMNTELCYPRIKRIQNKNGCINESYNYSTNQYLTRRCATAEQQDFFLSNNLVKNQKNMFKKCNNCSFDDNDVCTSCKIPKAKCVTIYKRSNRKFNRQGGVSGGSRINRLKYQTRMKAQTRRVNGKNNIINGKYPASLYAPGKPLILRDNTCKNPRPVIIYDVISGDYSFTIYWKDGNIPCGAKVDGYTIERTGSDYGHKIRVEANQKSYTYTFPTDANLIESTYDVRVRTESFYGPGSWAYKKDISFNTGPSAPTNVDLEDDGTRNLKLLWKKPQNNGGHVITDWKIRYFYGKRFVCKGDVADISYNIANSELKIKDGYSYDINEGGKIILTSGFVIFEIAGINAANLVGVFGKSEVISPNFIPVDSITNFTGTKTNDNYEFEWSTLKYTGHDISYNLEYSSDPNFVHVDGSFNVNDHVKGENNFTMSGNNVTKFKNIQTSFRLKYGNALNYDLLSNITGPAYWEPGSKITITIVDGAYHLSWPDAYKPDGVDVSYNIYYNNGNEPINKTIDVSNIKIPKLSYQETTISVEALSPFRIGNGTDPSLNVILRWPLVPGVPQNVRCTTQNRNDIYVTWDAPEWTGLYGVEQPEVGFRYEIKFTLDGNIVKDDWHPFTSGTFTLGTSSPETWGNYCVEIKSVVTYNEDVVYESNFVKSNNKPYIGFTSNEIDNIFKVGMVGSTERNDSSYKIGQYRYYLYRTTGSLGSLNIDMSFNYLEYLIIGAGGKGGTGKRVFYDDDVISCRLAPGQHAGYGVSRTTADILEGCRTYQPLGGGGGGAGMYKKGEIPSWNPSTSTINYTIGSGTQGGATTIYVLNSVPYVLVYTKEAQGGDNGGDAGRVSEKSYKPQVGSSILGGGKTGGDGGSLWDKTHQTTANQFNVYPNPVASYAYLVDDSVYGAAGGGGVSAGISMGIEGVIFGDSDVRGDGIERSSNDKQLSEFANAIYIITEQKQQQIMGFCFGGNAGMGNPGTAQIEEKKSVWVNAFEGNTYQWEVTQEGTNGTKSISYNTTGQYIGQGGNGGWTDTGHDAPGANGTGGALIIRVPLKYYKN